MTEKTAESSTNPETELPSAHDFIKSANKKLSEYNSIIKESDEIYHSAARSLGLPDCAFWILYVLSEGGEAPTQSELCDSLYQPKQTVNSSLKKLEADGFITLAQGKDRRSKQIHLTEKGRELASQTTDRVIAIEHNALSELSDEEWDIFIRLFHKYTDSLKKHMPELGAASERSHKT